MSAPTTALPAPPDSEARVGEALRLLRAVRDADVIFAKSDWPLSQEIAAFLAASGEAEE